MHKDAVRHFVNDLSGKVHLAPSGNKDIDAVISGKATLLGKGDDGIAFKVKGKVVKVSTTVPYQPDNPGHRSPKEAQEMLKGQVEMGNRLADLGIEGIQRSEYVEHGDKGFQIKPFVEIPDKLTRAQLDTLQRTVLDMHKHGYALHDDVQAGVHKGKLVMFDVGKAGPIRSSDRIYGDERVDIDNLQHLYREHGEVFVPLGETPGEEMVRGLVDGEYDAHRGKRFFGRVVERTWETLAKEAKATLSGQELTDRLDDIPNDFILWLLHVEDLVEDGKYKPKPGGPLAEWIKERE